MYEKIDSCPICESTTFENELICEDYSVSKEKFVIVKCTKCNFLFTNPRPDATNIGKYYDYDTYISHNSKGTTLLKVIYKLARYFAVKNKHNIIKHLAVSNNTLLDYGCGSGHFLAHCKTKGWQVAGIEPNDNARALANELTDNVVLKDMNELTESYQIITLWHVLEHIPDLNKTIELIKKKLNKNGTLLVAVPNTTSWDAIHYTNQWAAFDVPRHLYHFNQSTFKLLMKKHRLTIKKILPMKLDSFYVSMLSEKKLHGRNNYIRAFINGIKSNNYGNKNKNNYSSIIYIIKK